MRILGLIPARGNSKGVAKKNIKLLCGKPLIQYTSEVALSSKLIDKVIVSTDDEDIAKVSNSLGLEVPFIRPKEIANDESPTIDVIKHAIEFYRKKNVVYDAVCLLQVTSPLRTVQHLDDCIGKFIDTGCDTLISVVEVPHHYNPHWVFEEDNEGLLSISTGEKEIIPNRQKLPKSFYRDGSIYLIRTETIINHKKIFGEKISYVENPNTTQLNIDSMNDWIKAEKYFLKKNG